MKPRKTPFMKKKDAYEKDHCFLYGEQRSSKLMRQSWSKSKKKRKRKSRRKISQALLLVEKQSGPEELEDFSSDNFKIYDPRPFKFKDPIYTLRETVRIKLEYRAKQMVHRNFFRESKCNVGCCISYRPVGYENFSVEKKVRFENFLTSLSSTPHKYSVQIAGYFYRSWFKINHCYQLENSVQETLAGFFLANPAWEEKLINWVLENASKSGY